MADVTKLAINRQRLDELSAEYSVSTETISFNINV